MNHTVNVILIVAMDTFNSLFVVILILKKKAVHILNINKIFIIFNSTVIELACGESESASNIEVLNKMVLGTENGRNIMWFKNPDPLMVSISRSNLFAAKSNGE